MENLQAIVIPANMLQNLALHVYKYDTYSLEPYFDNIGTDGHNDNIRHTECQQSSSIYASPSSKH